MMREAFEAWITRDIDPAWAGALLSKDARGMYDNWLLREKWETWQAATERAAKVIRDMHAYTGGHGEPCAPTVGEMGNAIRKG